MLRFDLPQVWSNAIRLDAFMTFVIAAVALLLQAPLVFVLTLGLGAVRGFIGHHKCPVHQAWSGLLHTRGWGGKKEDVGAKMFAAKILAIASAVALVFHFTGSPLWQVPAIALLIFSFLEWAFSFCAGCWAYSAWYRRFPPRA